MVQDMAGYKKWAPVVARVLFAGLFLHSAWYKIPGSETFGMQVDMSGAAGLPFPVIAVTLAFVLEVITGIMLIVGYRVREAAIALMGFVVLIAFFFARDFSDQMQFMAFFSCLQLIAGLLYVSVYGAQTVALRPDAAPTSDTNA